MTAEIKNALDAMGKVANLVVDFESSPESIIEAAKELYVYTSDEDIADSVKNEIINNPTFARDFTTIYIAIYNGFILMDNSKLEYIGTILDNFGIDRFPSFVTEEDEQSEVSQIIHDLVDNIVMSQADLGDSDEDDDFDVDSAIGDKM